MNVNSILKGNGIFDKYIKQNFFKYLVILVIFLFGFLVGIGIFTKNISIEENANEIIEYITNNIEYIETQSSNIVASYVKQDYIEIFIICILSVSIIGVPIMLLFIFVTSISLGTTISALVYTYGAGTGISISIILFFIPILTKVFILLMMLSSSLKFIENIFKYEKEIKYELIRHALICLITVISICILSLYRTFSINLINQTMFI